ncbi:GTP-binding protein Obg/CgtA [Paxillus ammoniavirescens]|nr:GTP-binding protein Obg/CgtA [Paxillus ammoniavirescens]
MLAAACRRYSLLRAQKGSFCTTPTSRNAPDGFRNDSQLNSNDLDSSQPTKRLQRRAERKRRQGGETFLDHVIINVRGGRGGNGCVAFHREKFKPMGPPSGGSGGRGGDVYIMPTPTLTTLSSIPKRTRGLPGGAGQGTWQNGRNASPTIIKVPLGTVVRELPRDDPRRAKDEWESEEESLGGLSFEERRAKMLENRWVHYPRYEDDNVNRDIFKQAEASLWREERERRWARVQRARNPIHLDLSEIEEEVPDVNAPLALGRTEYLGHLVSRGGNGGLGNPHFLSPINRSPKFATKGQDGERITLELELKIIADIGLVGMPNAGKSTLLRALTGGRARTEVASYAFTTLNPVVGVIRVSDDGTFEGELQGIHVFEETAVEARMLEQEMEEELEEAEPEPSLEQDVSPNLDDTPASESTFGPGHHFDILESFRFTIADNPGLISRASEDVGLGHSFLRSIERSHALVYVVDLSGPAPWEELGVLRGELEKYQPGMSEKARLVIANKADLLAGNSEAQAVTEAKEKLAKLEHYVRTEMALGDGTDGSAMRMIDVVPISAKFSQNLKKVVGLMQTYVEEARDRDR